MIYISNKKYTDNDYVGVADLITQQELLTGLQKQLITEIN